jgi:hypothetical protein
VASHFVVFNYDGGHRITVTVFDETMCRRHFYGMIVYANNVCNVSKKVCNAILNLLLLETIAQPKHIGHNSNRNILANYGAIGGGDRARKPHCASRARSSAAATTTLCAA